MSHTRTTTLIDQALSTIGATSLAQQTEGYSYYLFPYYLGTPEDPLTEVASGSATVDLQFIDATGVWHTFHTITIAHDGALRGYAQFDSHPFVEVRAVVKTHTLIAGGSPAPLTVCMLASE